MDMTEEEQYLDGKIAGMQLAFATLVRLIRTDKSRLDFADFLVDLSVAPKSPSATPLFRAGMESSLKQIAADLIGNNDRETH